MMQRPEFSEFSFGYALTHSLQRELGLLTFAPVFPTLRAEAEKGYDLALPALGCPLFLQFKVPQIVTKNSVHTPPHFMPPYFRMHLRTKRRDPHHPSQHEVLMALEAAGNSVFYATPAFQTSGELNLHFRSGRVQRHSAFFAPETVGPLDEQSHYVAYETPSTAPWICSKPRRYPGVPDIESLSVLLAKRAVSGPGEALERLEGALLRSPEQGALNPRKSGGDVVWSDLADAVFPVGLALFLLSPNLKRDPNRSGEMQGSDSQ